MTKSGKFVTVNTKAIGGKVDRLIKMLLISIWEAFSRIALVYRILNDCEQKHKSAFVSRGTDALKSIN